MRGRPRLCSPGFSKGTGKEAPQPHGCDGALLRQRWDAGMLTLDLSKAAALSWAPLPPAWAGTEPSHAYGHVHVSSHVFSHRVLGWVFFFSFPRSSVSGCTGRVLQQPTSFAEHPYGQLSASDAPFSQAPFSCGLQGLAKAGTTRASPLALPCLRPCWGSRGHPCKRYHGCYVPERHQPSDRIHAAAAQHHTVLDECFLLNHRLKEQQGQAKSAVPRPSSAAGAAMLRFQALLQLLPLCKTSWYPKNFSSQKYLK